MTTAGVVLSNISSLGLHSPRGMAMDSQGLLYVADEINNRVVKFNYSSDSVLQIYTTTNPSLYYPQDVAVDSFDNVYIADSDNSRVVSAVSPTVLRLRCCLSPNSTTPTTLPLV